MKKFFGKNTAGKTKEMGKESMPQSSQDTGAANKRIIADIATEQKCEQSSRSYRCQKQRREISHGATRTTLPNSSGRDKHSRNTCGDGGPGSFASDK